MTMYRITVNIYRLFPLKQSNRLIIAVLQLFLAASLLSVNSTGLNDELQPANILVLDFELNDLTLNPDTSLEEKRVKTLRPFLAEKLSNDLNYSIATLSQPLRDKEDKGKGYIFDRPEVAARMARTAEADWVISGRLHKASFLFVYLKAQLINAQSGQISADFVVEIKGWEPRLTKKGIDALALQIDTSLQTLTESE